LSRIDFTGISYEVLKDLTYKLVWFTRDARRYLIRPHVVLRNDARPPILYLRSFSEDIEGYSYKLIQKTPEEQLVSEYNYWGPVIAVGQPGERHPFLGALRIYFDDEVWRAGVLYLMSVSQLVIIDAGISVNTLWELGMARKRVAPERLCISFMSWAEHDSETHQDQYLRFKKYAEKLLKSSLPEHIVNARYIRFEQEWKPTLH
jgi:hypothetical protein